MMDHKIITEVLEKLKNGEIIEYCVKKEDFLEFREFLVKREDFKYFRGIGQRGGDIIYEYQKTPRS